MHYLHLILSLGILAFGCDKPKDTGSLSEENPVDPSTGELELSEAQKQKVLNDLLSKVSPSPFEAMVDESKTYTVGSNIECGGESKIELEKTVLEAALAEAKTALNASKKIDPNNNTSKDKEAPKASLSLTDRIVSYLTGEKASNEGEDKDSKWVDTSSISLTYSYKWRFYSSLDDSGEDISESSSTLRLTRTHAHKYVGCSIEVKASNSLSYNTASSSLVAVSNLAPSDVSSLVDSSETIADSIVRCRGSAIDIDGDELSIAYQWKVKNGEGKFVDLVGEKYRVKEVSIGSDLVGKNISCNTIAVDSYGATSEALSDEVFIRNQLPAPFSSSLSLSNSSSFNTVKVGAELICGGSTTDRDAIAPLTYNTHWLISGMASFKGEDSGKLLITQAYAHKDIRCQKEALDEHGGVIRSFISDALVVENTPPSPFTPSISPSQPYVGDSLKCNAASSDIDGDSLSFEYRIEMASDPNGAFIEMASSQSFGLTMDHRLRYFRCKAWAIDYAGLEGKVESSFSNVVQIKNAPPEPFSVAVNNLTPVIGESVTCTGVTSDRDSPSITYDYEWQASLNASIPFVAIANSNHSSLTISLPLAHLIYRCRIKASDSDGAVTYSPYSPVISYTNSSPNPFTASLDPSDSPTKVNHSLLCQGTTTDNDGDNISYSYVFEKTLVSGTAYSEVRNNSTALYALSALEAHHYMRCKVIAKDNYSGETSSSYAPEVYISNTAPSAYSSSLSNSDKEVGDMIECAGDTIDLDGDSLSYAYTWLSSSSSNAGYAPVMGASSKNYTFAVTDSRKYFKCASSASDGYGGVTPSSQSSYIYVKNSNPNPFSSSFSSSGDTMGASLSCLGTTTDKNEDALTYEYQWMADTVNIAGVRGTAQTLIISQAEAHKNITCRVTAKDAFGGETSSLSSNTLLIKNSLPYFTQDPALYKKGTSTPSAYSYEEIECPSLQNDIDGDTLSLSYEWKMADSFIGSYNTLIGYSGSSIVLDFNFAHKYFKCIVTASDGHGGAVSKESNVLTVLNTKPQAFEAAISATSITYADTLTCSGSTYDVDQDPITITRYYWYRQNLSTGNFEEISGETLASFKPEAYALKHSAYRCAIEVTDGYDITKSSDSPIAMYVNTPPEKTGFFSTVTFTPSVIVGSTLTCSGTTLDYDSDPISYGVEWSYSSTANGTYTKVNNNPNFDARTLLITSTLAHKYIKCRVVARDGKTNYEATPTISWEEGLLSVTPVYVENSIPVWTSMAAQTIFEGYLYELDLSALVSDIDGADADELASITCHTCPTGATVTLVGSTYKLSWTPTDAQASSSGMLHNLVIRATDIVGGISSLNLDITVSNINPVFETLPTKGVKENAALDYNLSAQLFNEYYVDDETKVTVTCLTCPAGATVQRISNIWYIKWTPDYSAAGAAPNYTNPSFKKSYSISIKATHSDYGVAGDVYRTVPVEVENVNRSPTMSAVSCATANETGWAEIYFTATDPDGDQLTSSYSGALLSSPFTGAAATFGDSNAAISVIAGNYYKSTGYSTIPHGAPATRVGGGVPYSWYRDFTHSVTATDGFGAIAVTSCTQRINDVDLYPSANYISVAGGVNNCRASALSRTATDPDGDAITALTNSGTYWSGSYATSYVHYATYTLYWYYTIKIISSGATVWTDYYPTANGRNGYGSSTVISGCSRNSTAPHGYLYNYRVPRQAGYYESYVCDHWSPNNWINVTNTSASHSCREWIVMYGYGESYNERSDAFYSNGYFD